MRRALALAMVLGASSTLAGCSLLINAFRSSVSGGGGAPLSLGVHVTGNTQGGVTRRSISCGAAHSSPQHAYSFVAPVAASFTFDSTTSSHDGVLAIYDANGNELGCNDDHQSTRASQVIVSLAQGQSVEVLQGGYSGASGSYELWVSSDLASMALAGVPIPPPPLPQLLAPSSQVSGDTRSQPSLGPFACPPAGPMQEWAFTPTEDGTYLFQVDGEYDTYLGLLAPVGGEVLGCNDDTIDALHARVVADLVAGTTYRVIVGGASGQSGAYTLSAVTLPASGTLAEHRPLFFAPATTDSEPNLCGAQAGSPDRVLTFTPRQEAFYSIESDAPGTLVVHDGRQVIACLPLTPGRRSGIALKPRHAYRLVLELGVNDGQPHYLLVDRVAPDAVDWQIAPSPPPIGAALGTDTLL